MKKEKTYTFNRYHQIFSLVGTVDIKEELFKKCQERGYLYLPYTYSEELKINLEGELYDHAWVATAYAGKKKCLEFQKKIPLEPPKIINPYLN